MAERENIGALAVHFTAGVAAGTLLLRLPVSPYFLAGGLLIVLASLTAFVLRTERPALLFPTFLLVGAFCALADAFPGAETATFLERWASTLGGRLRDFIDSTPFPSESTAPLLKAFLTGDRSGLSRKTVQVFRGSGGAHLLALSGLHIGILYLFLSRLLWPLGNSPRARGIRYVLTVLAAALFTLLTGASPSIVRAFLFIFINETARLTGRPRNALRVLSTALLVQLVLDPSAITSVGFQLSYLAMAGIFILYPRLPLRAGLVAEGPPHRPAPQGLAGRRPVHLLPGIHRSPRLVPVPHISDLLLDYQPFCDAGHHPPHGLCRDDAPPAGHRLLPRIHDSSHRRPLQRPDLDPEGYFVNVKSGVAHSVMDPSSAP